MRDMLLLLVLATIQSKRSSNRNYSAPFLNSSNVGMQRKLEAEPMFKCGQ